MDKNALKNISYRKFSSEKKILVEFSFEISYKCYPTNIWQNYLFFYISIFQVHILWIYFPLFKTLNFRFQLKHHILKCMNYCYLLGYFGKLKFNQVHKKFNFMGAIYGYFYFMFQGQILGYIKNHLTLTIYP